jgi:hypothetical protein
LLVWVWGLDREMAHESAEAASSIG